MTSKQVVPKERVGEIAGYVDQRIDVDGTP
jgi:hypothetical protein